FALDRAHAPFDARGSVLISRMSVRRTAFLVWVGLAALLLPIAGEAQAAEPIFGQTTFTLKNGLQVVVVPNHRAPLVTQWVWYKVGGADEVRGKSGAAHFLEHLMFRGTKETPPGAFSRIIAANGGNDNAFT